MLMLAGVQVQVSPTFLVSMLSHMAACTPSSAKDSFWLMATSSGPHLEKASTPVPGLGVAEVGTRGTRLTSVTSVTEDTTVVEAPGPEEVLDTEEELPHRLLVPPHQLHRVVTVVEGVLPGVQEEGEPDLPGPVLLQHLLQAGEVRARWQAVTLVLLQQFPCTWMVMKFFRLLDILQPAMVRWPEWRK